MDNTDCQDSPTQATERGHDYWASREFLSQATRDAVRQAAIVLVPHENFRDQMVPVFPVGTTELFRMLLKKAQRETFADSPIPRSLLHKPALCQGTTLQVAEKLIRALCRGFIPGTMPKKSMSALAAGGMPFSNFTPNPAFFRKLFSRAENHSENEGFYPLRYECPVFGAIYEARSISCLINPL